MTPSGKRRLAVPESFRRGMRDISRGKEISLDKALAQRPPMFKHKNDKFAATIKRLTGGKYTITRVEYFRITPAGAISATRHGYCLECLKKPGSPKLLMSGKDLEKLIRMCTVLE